VGVGFPISRDFVAMSGDSGDAPLTAEFVANKGPSAFDRPVTGRSSIGHRTVTGRLPLGRSRSSKRCWFALAICQLLITICFVFNDLCHFTP
jgi:hypothetical protein